MIFVILIEPENSGNIGAIARVMKNFSFDKLIIVNPKASHKNKEAMDRAKYAKEILENAKVMKKIPELDYLIATTAKIGTDYNINRSPLNPEELGKKISKLNKNKTNIGILLGREGIGLMNKEIEKCDFIVTIPTSKSYGTMNVSHSASVILYEIYKNTAEENIISHIPNATATEKKIILKTIDNILSKMDFSTKEKKVTQKKLWKRIIGKSMLTKREAYALMGFLKKIK